MTIAIVINCEVISTLNLLQIRKMTFLCDKHYMREIIVSMAAKMPEVILTEYGLL